ncbi:nuclear transport factor 2 family protein [Lutimonas saemankumensis]|uniref:YybH family protein n=1 Tax=Lutimonas saemankumensis TaxID=483016 RepID=UPI001CD64E6D|nr:nuclear transport factor 2 family protein [Lutimonas saemankumensis]MCA0933390.1 nuclear transport factor 2 family protein [Lutimonas saemankumensis]
MKKIVLLLTVVLLSSFSEIETKDDKTEIRKVMADQQEAWNNYDLEGFMQGYWKSEELKFYGSNGVTYGWNNTLARYKKAYPSKEYSGTLKFVINDISKISRDAYYVMGEYHLERSVGNADGIFMIIFKKIKGEWKIISDTSC